jgi:hypothetical protein
MCMCVYNKHMVPHTMQQYSRHAPHYKLHTCIRGHAFDLCKHHVFHARVQAVSLLHLLGSIGFVELLKTAWQQARTHARRQAPA